MKILKNFKKGLFLVVMTALVLSACGSGGAFVSEEGRFSVVFPGKPTQDSSTRSGPDGDLVINVFSYDVDVNDKDGSIVMYMDFPEELIKNSDFRVLLDGGLQGQLAVLGSNLVIEAKEEIQIDGNPGLYARANADGVYAVTRDYLVGNRAYVLMMVKEGGYPSADEEKVFLDSFKLLK